MLLHIAQWIDMRLDNQQYIGANSHIGLHSKGHTPRNKVNDSNHLE